MIIGAQEIMHALRGVVHIRIGLSCRIIPLVMLARPRQRREFAMHGIVRLRSRRRIQRIERQDRKSTRLNSSHSSISYAVFCLKKKINIQPDQATSQRYYKKQYWT